MWDKIIENINVILIVISLVSIFLIFINSLWPKYIFNSSHEYISKGDLLGVYYLPESILELTVITKAIMEVQNTSVISAKVISQEFKISEKVKSNFSKPIYLNYRNNPFSDEEVDFNLDSNGLLDTISGSSDNRLDDIIFSLTDFTAESHNGIEASFAMLGKRQRKKIQIIEREFTNHFKIPISELIQGTIKKKWDVTLFLDQDIGVSKKIPVGFNVDLSKKYKKPTLNSQRKKVTGLFFPHRSSLSIEILSLSGNLTSQELQISYYSSDNYYIVPVKRTPFAHRIHSLKIQDGLLKSHHVTNPSSMVGLASIPVKAGKALMSIPAQIFKIHIGNFKKRAELEKLKITQMKDLVEAKNDLIKSESELIKTKSYLKELKKDSNSEIDNLNQVIRDLKQSN